MIGMNKDNVIVGDKFSTMSKFYKQLELPNVKGNQKKAQDKEVARWFEWELTGTNKRAKNEIVVTVKRETPLDKVDGRHTAEAGKRVDNGQNKYIDDLIPLLHSYISRVGERYVSTSKLLIALNLVHNDYSRIFNDTTKLSKDITNTTDIKITNRTIEDFYHNINRTMSDATRLALSKLEKQGKIEYRNIVYVMYQDDDETYQATEEDIKIIQKNEQFALEEFVERGIIKEPKKNSFMNFENKRKYNKYLADCLVEDGIVKTWQMIYFKPIKKEILTNKDKYLLESNLKNKFAETVETRMTNIKWLNPAYAKGFGEKRKWKSDNPAFYNYLYDEMYNQYGWFKMEEIIKFMFMLNDDIKQKWIDKLDEEVKDCLDAGFYQLDEVLPIGTRI